MEAPSGLAALPGTIFLGGSAFYSSAFSSCPGRIGIPLIETADGRGKQALGAALAGLHSHPSRSHRASDIRVPG